MRRNPARETSTPGLGGIRGCCSVLGETVLTPGKGGTV